MLCLYDFNTFNSCYKFFTLRQYPTNFTTQKISPDNIHDRKVFIRQPSLPISFYLTDIATQKFLPDYIYYPRIFTQQCNNFYLTTFTTQQLLIRQASTQKQKLVWYNCRTINACHRGTQQQADQYVGILYVWSNNIHI